MDASKGDLIQEHERDTEGKYWEHEKKRNETCPSIETYRRLVPGHLLTSTLLMYNCGQADGFREALESYVPTTTRSEINGS